MAAAKRTDPKLGERIDEIYRLEQKIRGLEANHALKVAALKSLVAARTDEVLAGFSEEEIAGATGKLATAERRRSAVPSLKDWAVFTAWVKKTGSFDLLERRVAKTAWRDRLDAGVKVPGVETFNRVYLSVRKRTRG